jgi:hypothetical protein
VTPFAAVLARTITASAAAALAVGANLDYLRNVRRPAGDPGRARPRLASWVIWTGAMSIGAYGAGRVRQWPSAALGLAGAATSVSVLACGWDHSKRDVGWLDFAAGFAGGAGLVLVTESGMGMVPAGAGIIAAVLADAAAFTLTFRNAWAGRESPRPFALYALAGVLALAASSSVAGAIYPAYEAAACSACAVIAWRRHGGLTPRRRLATIGAWKLRRNMQGELPDAASNPPPEATQTGHVARPPARRRAGAPPAGSRADGLPGRR